MADLLQSAGDLELPMFSMLTPISSKAPVCKAIFSINKFKDCAVAVLKSQAEVFSNNQVCEKSERTDDITSALQNIKTSLQQLLMMKDQMMMARRTLENCRDDCGLLEQIENLKNEAIIEKTREMNSTTCSFQWRKPERSFNTFDVIEIMELALVAKSLIYYVQGLIDKVVDSVKDKQKTLTDIDKSKQEISDLKQCYNVYIEDLEINQDFPKKSKK